MHRPAAGQVEERKFVVGACFEMCPAKERERRQKERRVDKFEMNPSTLADDRPDADFCYMVKEYCRSAAGREKLDVGLIRHPSTLKDTMLYLISRIVPRTDVPWWQVYRFVDDRYRAIHQDLTVQGMPCPDAVPILEQAVRFHLLSAYWLCEADVEKFDFRLNDERLQNCFTELLCLYDTAVDDCHVRGSPFRPELEACAILHCSDITESLTRAMRLPEEIRQSPEVQLAVSLSQALDENNFVRFFRLCRKTTALSLCALHASLAILRQDALRVMNKAYAAKNSTFPIDVVVRWLAADDDHQVERWCEKAGLSVAQGKVFFRRDAFLESDASWWSERSAQLIDSKLPSNIAQWLTGCLDKTCITN